MADINTLQKAIEKKAEQRLDSDIFELMKQLKENRLCRRVPNNPTKLPPIRLILLGDAKDQDYVSLPDNTPQRTLTLREFAEDYGNPGIVKLLKERWLPVYIQEETENFLKKVDELEERVAELGVQADDLEQRKQDRNDY